MACPCPSPAQNGAMFARLGGEEDCACCLAADRRRAGCGGGERQDENEPEGNFAVEVVNATFPEQQKLAQSSNLAITVRNAGDETVPNIAVTVDRPQLPRRPSPDLADSGAPAVRGQRRSARDRRLPGGEGRDAARLRHGLREHVGVRPAQARRGERTFVWKVTAVKAGPYKITWRVAAGLNGKAKAVAAGRRRGADRQLHRHRLRRGARRCAWPTTARPSSPRHADVARALLHRQPRVLRVARRRSWSARTSRTRCRACCARASGACRCRTVRRSCRKGSAAPA